MVAAGPNQFEIDFTPPAGLPPVASVAFEGNKLITAMLLQNRAAAVAFGQPYTEAGFRILLDNQIRPLYEQGPPARDISARALKIGGALDESPCMDVTVTVDEGPEYKLTRVAVTGRSAEENAAASCTARAFPK